VLTERGFASSEADLTVVGTVADMCVMTSVVHACALGYSVSVLEHVVLGGGEDSAALQEGWALPEPSSSSKGSGPQDWRMNVYNSYTAAGRRRAFRYMEAAGAKIVSSPVTELAPRSTSASGPRGFPRPLRQR